MKRPLLLRGVVHTNDPARPLAEAVLVRGDRIEALGTLCELARLAPEAELVGTPTSAVLPGLVDGHAHPMALGRALSSVRLGDARSMRDVVEACRRWAESNPQGWILGHGWDQTLWAGPDELPDARALDAAFPARPVLLTRIDGHAAMSNLAARRAAGLRDDAADPPGGRIVRDASGAATGVLVDTALEVVAQASPQPTPDDRERWLLAAARHALALGLTGVHDAGVDLGIDAAYRALAGRGALALRTYAMADLLHPQGLSLLADGPRSELDLYTLRAVKLFADGALGSRGAELFGCYCDAPTSGLAVQSDDELRARAEPAVRSGFQLCVHAIGDRANARVLELFEGLVRDGFALPRPRIEHAQILRVSDRPRLLALGAVAAMQPGHAITDMRFAARRLGEDRLPGAYAWRSLIEAGIPVAFGSDFPVEPADPRLGFHAATTRTDRDGQPPGGWRAHEAVTGPVALDAFTHQNAYASFREHDLGRIRPGFKADLTVLDRDPLGTEARWLDARVLATVVDGRVRFSA